MIASSVAAVIFLAQTTLLPAVARTYDNRGNSQSLMSDDSYEKQPHLDGISSPGEVLANDVASVGSETRTFDAPCRYDLTLMSSLAGAYMCQAVMLNAIFTVIAMVSQKIQEMLQIDTSAMLLGQLAGIITVTMGGYTAYKTSEMLLKILLVHMTSTGLIKRGKELLSILRDRDTHSVTEPFKAISTLGEGLWRHTAVRHLVKNLALLVTPTDIGSEAKKEVMGSKYKRATVESRAIVKPHIREAAAIAIYCISTFALLGGRLHSFTPSDISQPGAFAIPSLSLLADGYNYATKQQKRIIQQIGRKYGCHTCGYISKHDKYIADHQPPSGVVKRKLKHRVIRFLLDNRIVPLYMLRPRQYFHPQCQRCSTIQAKAVRSNR